jgi:hypothetical protein
LLFLLSNDTQPKANDLFHNIMYKVIKSSFKYIYDICIYRRFCLGRIHVALLLVWRVVLFVLYVFVLCLVPNVSCISVLPIRFSLTFIYSLVKKKLYSLLIFLIQIFCSLFDSVMLFYCFSWICFEWIMQCLTNLSFDGNHMFSYWPI